MTQRELIDTYMASIGRKLEQGENAEPLLPFLLGDAIYDIYNKDIRTYPLHHDMKRIRNAWAAAYTRFNKPFFKAFDEEASIQVTDLMDDFEEYIADDLTILRSHVVRILGDEIPFEKRQVITSALLCHVLAQCAEIAWGNVHRVTVRPSKFAYHVKPEYNRDLDTINHASFVIGNHIHAQYSTKTINPNKCKDVPPALSRLCKRIYQWLEEEPQARKSAARATQG